MACSQCESVILGVAEMVQDKNKLVQEVEQLRGALTSRILIEQGKGYMAAKLAIEPDMAFEIIRSFARSRQYRIKDICQLLITGQLKPEATLKSVHPLFGKLEQVAS